MSNAKRWLVKYSLLLLFGTSVLPVCAQQHPNLTDKLAAKLQIYTDSLAQTNIYIRTDKGIYEQREDLWFKAYQLDAQQFLLSSLDKTMYVQLVNAATDSIVWKEKYFIDNGIATGHVYIGDSLPEGNYFLAAYTSHSYFEKRPEFQALRKIRIIKGINDLRKGNARQENLQKIAQFSLLPEGGHLVAGLINQVAFKAVNAHGEPLDVSGTLLENNTPLTDIKSLHAGMGSFTIKPQPGKKYAVQLTDSVRYPLPAIESRGMVMRVVKNDNDSLHFMVIQPPGEAEQPVYLRLQVRGLVQMIAAGKLVDSLSIKLSIKNVPQGIAEATLYDQRLIPMAERLVYLHLNKQLHITASLTKEMYATREKVTIKIKTTDQGGQPIVANVGINVYDKLYQNTDDAMDIMAHYQLSTQLKGRIYNPGYYFNAENKDRALALDLLLLTQGWRSYQWNEEQLAEKNQRPLTDGINGQLLAVKKKRGAPSQSMLMVFDPEQTKTNMLLLDSMQRFTVSPEELLLGKSIYLKHFGTESEVFDIKTVDPFAAIAKDSTHLRFSYPLSGMVLNEKKDDILPVSMTRGKINLAGVEVVSKGAPVFRDKFIGHLDSMAKYENNTDFVKGGFLNCPACSSGDRPIEGKKYTVYTGPNPPRFHPFSFNAEVTKEVIYHYPTFTEEELLKRNHLTRISGYYVHREFYQPDYDKEPNSLPDYRNTLLWAPAVITNEQGEATVEFFCSDINTRFVGMVEGVGGEGLIGKYEFKFNVNR